VYLYPGKDGSSTYSITGKIASNQLGFDVLAVEDGLTDHLLTAAVNTRRTPVSGAPVSFPPFPNLL
jgi:hypothetical protein